MCKECCAELGDCTVDFQGPCHHPVQLSLQVVVLEVFNEGPPQLSPERVHAVDDHQVQEYQVRDGVGIFGLGVLMGGQGIAESGQRFLRDVVVVFLGRVDGAVEAHEQQPVADGEPGKHNHELPLEQQKAEA